MVKNVFLKRVKIGLLAYKLDVDLVNQIISEIEVKYDILRQKGISPSDIEYSMDGVDGIVKSYVNKFGSTEIKSVSSKTDSNTVSYGSSSESPIYNNEKKEKSFFEELKDEYRKEYNKEVKKDKNRNLSDSLRKSPVESSYDNEGKNSNRNSSGSLHKNSSTDLEKKKKWKNILRVAGVVIILLGFVKNNDTWQNGFFNNITDGGLGSFVDNEDPAYSMTNMEPYKTINLDTDSVSVDVIEGSEFKMDVYPLSSGDTVDFNEEFEMKNENGVLSLVQKRLGTSSFVSKIEITIPTGNVVDVNMKTLYGELVCIDVEPDKTFGNIKLDSFTGSLIYRANETCNIDFKAKENGSVDIHVNKINAKVKLEGSVEYIQTSIGGEEGIELTDNKYEGIVGDGRDNISIKMNKGYLTFMEGF